MQVLLGLRSKEARRVRIGEGLLGSWNLDSLAKERSTANPPRDIISQGSLRALNMWRST